MNSSSQKISAVMRNYGDPKLEFIAGKGSYLTSTSGEKYLDFTTGIAVNSLGHCHPKLVTALQEQSEQLWHSSNLYRISQAESLAKKLIANTFADRVFFCNSGTEAIEAGIKIIRRYFFHKGHQQKNRIIALTSSFHGRTLGALALANNPTQAKGFLHGDGGFDQVEYGNVDELKRTITDKTAGIVIEPIQGEGGIRVAMKDYLAEIKNLCEINDLLLFFDEVQSGVGRSGSLYAYQELGIQPDLLATAKGLGGGIPIGACITTESIAEAMTPGTHGSTFGGNPLAAAAANAVLDEILSPNFLREVKNNSRYLFTKLETFLGQYPNLLRDVNGMGFMVGLGFHEDASEVVKLAEEEKLLLVKAGRNYIRLLPPLNISIAEIDEAIEIIERCLQRCS
ncbi:MAG: aspartate aminotransferase family protein [Gammaproteobacteria bacterium]|nr:aspartate aminotransferase family protein [Gammaproteobacteria bacterium]